MVHPFHFMPEAGAALRGRTALDESEVALGAERLRAALDGVHPGMGRWGRWSDGRAIGRSAGGGEYGGDGPVSFLAAAMICRKASFPKLTGKFAYVESLYATHLLNSMMHGYGRPAGGLRQSGVLNPLCREVLGAEPGRDGAGYTIPVQEYLEVAVGLGRSWKLVNQTVHAGLVSVERDSLVRLLRDAITAYIRERIKSMPDPPVEVPPEISGWCADRAEAASGGDTPPCVEQCRARMDAGENLQHTGRFLLATFSMHAGADDDSIAAMFEGAPDYSPKVTKYHIGQIRRGEYSVPSCRWISSNGLCPGCDAPHPTKYRKPAE